MKRMLGLDYGSKRIGAAISDPNNKIALEFDLIENEDIDSSIYKIDKIITENNIGIVVVGIPLGLKNIVTNQTDSTLKFIDRLQEELKIKIEKVDERFTTKIASNFIKNKKSSKIGHIDIKSAQIILQDYLDKINN